MQSFKSASKFRGGLLIQSLALIVGFCLLPAAAKASAICTTSVIGPADYTQDSGYSGQTGTITQTCVFSQTTADVASATTSGTFLDFGNSSLSGVDAALGQTLTAASLSVSMSTYLSQLSFSNLDVNPTSFYFTDNSRMTLADSGSIASGDFTALKAGQYNNGAFNSGNSALAKNFGTTVQMFDVGSSTGSQQALAANTSVTYFGTAPLDGSTPVTPTSGLDNTYCAANHCTAYNDTAQGFGGLTYAETVNSSSVSTYNANSSFTIGYNTISNYSYTATNEAAFNVAQILQTSGAYSVTYTFTDSTPEPSTWLLTGSALLAAGLFFRKRRTA